MKTFLFTDTHFGTKQNSITWLKYQEKFILEQFIPAIKKYRKRGEHIRVIHLGDVFDSRSTISTLVATRVVNAFKQITEVCDEFYIIGGNHDYYSPKSDSVDTLNLLLGNLPLEIITSDIKILSDNKLLVPWYSWFDQDNLQEVINKNHIKSVFTHADIISSPISIHGVDIYSGHTHIPYINGRIKNLGSCYPLNFADANTPRGYYILEDDDTLSFHENTASIKYWRLYNEDIFKDNDINRDDYVELYISQTNMSKPEYNEKINELSNKIKNIWTIPQIVSIEGINESKFEGYDIETISKELVPDELKEKFNLILGKCKL